MFVKYRTRQNITYRISVIIILRILPEFLKIPYSCSRKAYLGVTDKPEISDNVHHSYYEDAIIYMLLMFPCENTPEIW